MSVRESALILLCYSHLRSIITGMSSFDFSLHTLYAPTRSMKEVANDVVYAAEAFSQDVRHHDFVVSAVDN